MSSLSLAVMKGIVHLMRSVPSFVRSMAAPGRRNEAQEKRCESLSAGLDSPSPEIHASPLEAEGRGDEAPVEAPAWQRCQFEEADLPVLDSERACFMEELALSRQATGMIRKSNLLLRMHHFMTHPEASSNPAPAKRELQILSSIDAGELKSEIFRKLGNEQVYLTGELTIASFAHELGIEPHQLSRFLNLHLNTTYTDLINSYRVHEAKALLRDKPGDSILDIAFSSGFSSKASFNRIFKKMAGMTPSEYRLKYKAGGASGTAAMKAGPVSPPESRQPGD
ncbi:MAG TPA: helix-turn-helix domain-containing protein [Deltaproteobacteria bacterium]|nr:helix-turn-helix domain-containing protein [Deltaproteobacteria bacterium]HQJ07432.1 helix-turn-helix domain-containing protein [Deltaproteobacteria bacterium]